MNRFRASLALAAAFLAVLGATADPDPTGVVRVDPPAVAGAMAPNLLAADGAFFLSWLEPARPGGKPGEEGDWILRAARFAGAWGKPWPIATGADFFINWADFPSIAASRNGLFAHWAAMSGPGKYSYDVELARSPDGGRSWSRLGKAHDDRTESEHGFVSLVPEDRGVRAFWLDGRAMEAATGEEEGGGDMALFTAAVTDRAGKGELLDPRTCECCQTSAALTAAGPVIVYRDRSKDEVRDIAIVRRVAGRWSEPALVHADGWKIQGCPVNGPAAAAEGSRVAVAWFTGANDRPRVLAAFSKDAGATFGRPVEIEAREPLGRVDVLLDSRGDAIVSWVAQRGRTAEIRLRRVSGARATGLPLVAATTTPDRTSGFPRIERSGSTILLAWVETGQSSRLRAATLSEARIPPVSRGNSASARPR